MSNYTTLASEETLNAANTAPVALEAASATVEVIDLKPNAKSFKLDEYLANSLPTAGGIASALEMLERERETWECTEMAASHARLYAILAQCYGFYLSMKSETTGKGVRKQLVAGLDMFIQQRGLKTLAKTHDMNKVVKAVFGEDRRRVSAYAMALRVALTSGPDVQAKTAHVPADELATWIESKGGVEEVRLGSKNNGMSEKERAEVAKAAIEEGVPLLIIKPDAKTMPFGADDVDKPMVLLVFYRPSGELEVSSVVKNDSVVRAALAAHYAANKDDMSDAKQGKAAAMTTAVSMALAK